MNIFLIPTDTCYGIGCTLGDSKSYRKIYKIKKRGYDKPLAVMVESLDWLYENTTLTEEQLNFVSEYERPYTILTDCPRITMLLSLEDETTNYPNHEQYTQVAFRVAHTAAQKKLIKNHGPIFLTSANLSGREENYTINDLKEGFKEHMAHIDIIENINLDENISPSDIFSFEWETLKLNYLRKN